MRRTFAHHFSDQLKSEKTISSTSNIMARSFGAFALNQLSLSESRLVSKKPRRLGNCSHKTGGNCSHGPMSRQFFKDLVSSDGHPSSCLQQSIEISGAENVTS